MIEGAKIKKLNIIPDNRGRLMEILRDDDEIFQKFGQVYMTTAYPNIVKAWHYHKLQTDNFTCVKGKIKLVLFDAREKSSTFKEINEFVLSLDTPMLVQIPPLVYHGFKCISKSESIIINVPTLHYDRNSPDEYRIDAFKNNIPYDWRRG